MHSKWHNCSTTTLKITSMHGSEIKWKLPAMGNLLPTMHTLKTHVKSYTLTLPCVAVHAVELGRTALHSCHLCQGNDTNVELSMYYLVLKINNTGGRRGTWACHHKMVGRSVTNRMSFDHRRHKETTNTAIWCISRFDPQCKKFNSFA